MHVRWSERAHWFTRWSCAGEILNIFPKIFFKFMYCVGISSGHCLARYTTNITLSEFRGTKRPYVFTSNSVTKHAIYGWRGVTGCVFLYRALLEISLTVFLLLLTLTKILFQIELIYHSELSVPIRQWCQLFAFHSFHTKHQFSDQEVSLRELF